jgi:hypothetical protein
MMWQASLCSEGCLELYHINRPTFQALKTFSGLCLYNVRFDEFCPDLDAKI